MVTKIENMASPTPSFRASLFGSFSLPHHCSCARKDFVIAHSESLVSADFFSSHLNCLIAKKGVTTSAFQRLRPRLSSLADPPADPPAEAAQHGCDGSSGRQRAPLFPAPGRGVQFSAEAVDGCGCFAPGTLSSVPRGAETTAPPVGSRLGGQRDSLRPRTKGSETLKGPQEQQRLDNKIRPGVWGAGTWNTTRALLSAISCHDFQGAASTGVTGRFAGLPNLGRVSPNVALKFRVVI